MSPQTVRAKPIEMRKFLLWDHDGVLVDTERLFFAATRDSLRELGIALEPATYLRFMAEGRSCWTLALEAGIAESAVARARSDRDRRYRESLVVEPIEIDGVREVLRALRPEFRMAIVTTSKRSDFAAIHRDRDLLEFFELVVTVVDCARPKPHPDPYLEALRRLGAEPAEALAIEDSSRGLRAATAAGLDCVVVRSALTEGQDFSGAWRVLGSVRELPGLLSG
jgi:HAD superfamily hydrolase (TIGR01509 family)